MKYTIEGSKAQPMTFRAAVRYAIRRYWVHMQATICDEQGMSVATVNSNGWFGDMAQRAAVHEASMRSRQ